MNKPNEMHIRVEFIEPVLGMTPGDPEIASRFIASKAPDAKSMEEELEAISTEDMEERTMTVFPRTEDGQPFFWDYQIKGHMKDTCGGLRRVKGSLSSKVTAYKKIIDKLMFPRPRRIVIQNVSEIRRCQRPLRAATPQGERISLANSEEIPAGAYIEFTVEYFNEGDADLIREWFDYGIYSGMGQWRNSGKGRFVWDEIDENGEVIGGNNVLGEKKKA